MCVYSEVLRVVCGKFSIPYWWNVYFPREVLRRWCRVAYKLFDRAIWQREASQNAFDDKAKREKDTYKHRNQYRNSYSEPPRCEVMTLTSTPQQIALLHSWLGKLRVYSTTPPGYRQLTSPFFGMQRRESLTLYT